MADASEAGAGRGRSQMRDFIFARELAEVYLLLDHVSGRPDKTLAAVANHKEPGDTDWIEKICEIGWPPKGTELEQARQAATLLKAKDRLNAAAYPANGATIAFTLLVAGEDDLGRHVQNDSAPRRTLWQRWAGLFHKSVPPSASPAGTALDAPPLSPPGSRASGNDGGGSDGEGDGGRVGWRREPPSRMSLARLAYPGLVGTAGRFKRWISAIIVLLLLWLVFTCALSWNVAAGRASLARLDALGTQRSEILKKISDIESEEAAPKSPPPAAEQAAAGSAPPAVERARGPVLRYCDRPLQLAPMSVPNGGVQQFNSVTEHQNCDQLVENGRKYAIAREDLADWLDVWGWLKHVSHCKDCRTESVASAASSVLPVGLNEQWAGILVEVLSAAVLPLCYGLLGAGAAVVRSLWSKMRDSLLSPRDLTLALGQLALGAVIGACIGLFVAPSGAASQGQGAVGLTGSVALSASALSFIAGFGVEGVFVALESLIKRVFNISEPSARPA